MMGEPKNIVVCCDGTANEFKKDRTNVVKLFHTLVKDRDVQVCYYHPGVGTMAAPGFVTKTGAKLAEIAGLAFGYGLNDDICDAYTFIVQNFEPGDRLYLFGFSRGAYTARAIASLLRMYGLLPKDNARLAVYAIRMMWAIRRLQRKRQPGGKPDPRIDEYFRLADEFKATFSRECKPHFVGVWDTVSSVGWFSHPVSLPYTANNPDIAIGRHAIALDERRAFFRTNLWRSDGNSETSGPKDLKQVWFPGVHCDIGGGYPECESGLSKIPLKWMLDEARNAGLRVDEEKVALVSGERGGEWAAPDPDGKMHESLTRGWRPAEYVPKPRWDGRKTSWRANRFRRRTIPIGSWIHDAAWVRDKGQYQENLPRSALRLSVVDPADNGHALLTGKLRLSWDERDLPGNAAAIAARIQRIVPAADKGTQADDPGVKKECDVVVPAGVDRARIVDDLCPGRYRVQAYMPSGRILQTERVVAANELVDVRLHGESSEREWLSWQRFTGVTLDPSALRQRTPLRRKHGAAAGADLSLFMSEIVPALRRPARLDWPGVKYLVHRSARAVLNSLSDRTAAVFGAPRGATLCKVILRSESIDWSMLADVTDPTHELEKWTANPDLRRMPGPYREEGAVRLWELRQSPPPLPGFTEWRAAFLLEAHDTFEIGLAPTSWRDVEDDARTVVELLVDESRTRQGARLSVIVRDNTLGGLLAYLGHGNGPALRIMLTELRRKEALMTSWLEANPLAVCAVLYAAIAVSDAENDWCQLLIEALESRTERAWNGHAPPADARVLLATRRIAQKPDDTVAALSALKSAFSAGIPAFSAGVFLLRDTLARYASCDSEAQRTFETVSKLATRVDPTQAFTVIRYPIT